MAAMDVPASKSSFGVLYINDVYWGLYLMMQNTDSDYLKTECGNDDGTFYKCRHDASLEYMGPDPKTYENYTAHPTEGPTYKLDRNSTHYEAFVDFVQLVSALNASTEEEFVEQFQQIMDVKEYLRDVVFDCATGTPHRLHCWTIQGNHDSYAFDANNYALYHNTNSGLFQYIGYDTDLSWGLSSHPDNAVLNVYEYENTLKWILDCVKVKENFVLIHP